MVVLQRAIFSVNSVYNIPNVKIRGRAFATNNVPSDAYRGFGAPQGLFAMEAHMSHLARAIKVDELKLKQQYLLKQGDVTITNGRIHEGVKLPEIIQRIDDMSGYSKKLKKLTPGSWRGIGISLFNHGSGFTGNGEQEIILNNVNDFYIEKVDNKGVFRLYFDVKDNTDSIKSKKIVTARNY
jgi:CO/xanthine dehydrogenase Mo-binding subunit